jgi:2-keto-4-pentenoate hydratase/2-oxohepta-3-ene-1,7-dioic acid hydratase in catechol pathway
MRWIRFAGSDAVERLGLVVGEQVHALPGPADLVDLLRADTLASAARTALTDSEAPRSLADLAVLAPIGRPASIRDFMAFEQHVDGVSRLVSGRPQVPDVWHRQPLFYFSNPAAVVGPFDDVPVPPGCSVLDFELEIAAVIGRAGADLTIDEAEASIAGFMIMNDWSARDLQFAEMEGPLGPCKGKDSAITLGPAFVSADELADRRSGSGFDLGLRAFVNDEVIGEDRWDSIAWSFAEMVAYASRGTRVEIGDVIGSGTCGNGCLAELWGRFGRESRPPLQVGDVVRLEVDRLGATANRVVAGPPVRQPLVDRRHRGA